MTHLLALPLLLGLLAAEPAGEHGPCPVQGAAPCILTLAGAAGPTASAECSSAAWSELLHFTLPQKFTDSNRDGSWETVLEIRLDPTRDCGCARFKVYYDDAPSGWTVHLGNSPTNNGHGGDQGTTPEAAEVQVLERKLSVFTASRRQQVDKLLDVSLPTLARGVVELEVCNQTLDVQVVPARRGAEPAQWKLGTLSSKLLLSFGPAHGKDSGEDGGSLHAAFNRVIHQLRGAPSHGRVGAGVRRVEISLSP